MATSLAYSNRWIVAMRCNSSFFVRGAELFGCTAGKPVLASSLAVGFTLLLSLLIYTPYTHAAPNGGNIVGGAGSINASGLTTTINQNSSSMAINWNSFDVNQHEIVNFIQPGRSSIALNQILGNNASQIHGQINANGHIVLVNPNGLFFGKNATLNVGGLIASGLSVSQ